MTRKDRYLRAVALYGTPKPPKQRLTEERARVKAARRAYLARKPRPARPLYRPYNPSRRRDTTPEPRNGWCHCARSDLRATGGVCRFINPDPDRSGRFACFGVPF